MDKPGNCFERNQVDEFGVESIDLGALKKIRIGHDNSAFGSSWFLDKVIIKNESNIECPSFYFLCGKWLAKGKSQTHDLKKTFIHYLFLYIYSFILFLFILLFLFLLISLLFLFTKFQLLIYCLSIFF